jgi:4-hydroxybenzoate polyprenyltransferase
MKSIVKLLRPHQWTKNLACLGGVLFGGSFLNPKAISFGLLMVVSFSAISSAMYILNDVQDRERDRQHPKKKLRPIASGQISILTASCLSILLVTVGMVIAFQLSLKATFCLILYVVINISYSFKLKHSALFDVNCIALGFVLRLLSGIYAIGNIPTAWITLCTFSLALVLGFCKRRAELYSIKDSSQSGIQRPVLIHYTLPYLDSLISSTSTMTIVSYALFTVTSGKNPSLVVTVPIVYFAIFHYTHLVMIRQRGEEPERILLKDKKIQLSLILWLICYLLITHGNFHFFS